MGLALDWESHKSLKHDRERPYLFDAKTTTVEQISLLKLICSKNDELICLIVLPVG